MSLLNFKAVFKGSKDNEDLNLIFRSIEYDKPIKILPQIILELKRLSDISENVTSLQNIEEVVEIGTSSSKTIYNYYFIILSTSKDDGEKEGYLIGNAKKLGDILIGIWPFNKELKKLSPEKIFDKLNDLIKKPHKYSDICLIN